MNCCCWETKLPDDTKVQDKVSCAFLCLNLFHSFFMFSHDTDNSEFQLALDFISNTSHPVFLTGKAGTGKTTFLKYIQSNILKTMAIVAPTGVAAMNAGGTTIHSFFQLPFAPFIGAKTTGSDHADFTDRNSLLKQLKLNAERREILQQLDLLVIDEISMVRADLLDAIDLVLRYVRHNYSKPFGGVQLLYIGDMYQLPPVVKQDEWHLLHTFYESPFFFSSHVIKEQPPVYIELNKVYRQKDKNFIHLLNQVRNNEMDEDGYELLHSRHIVDTSSTDSDGIIILTTHNAKADAINSRAIDILPGEEHYFKATINGIFQDNSFPTDENLLLKKGAQVMFIKNDMEKVRRYFNGKIGTVQSIADDKVWIECKNGDATNLIELKKETWRNIKYSINSKSGNVDEDELGSFTQFPLRLAWAITIHKSQGLTFEKVIIDAGSSFAPGQVYVALSRCTTLEGLHLVTKISMNSLQSDPRIVAFAQEQKSRAKNMQLLDNTSKENEFHVLTSLFDFAKIDKSLARLSDNLKPGKHASNVTEWTKKIHETWAKIYGHSKTFQSQLSNYNPLAEPDEINFRQRVVAASVYFAKELESFNSTLCVCPMRTDNRQIAKEIDDALHSVVGLIELKVFIMQGCAIAPQLRTYYQQKKCFSKSKASFSAYAGRSALIPENLEHPELYTLLKNKRDQLCNENNLPVYLVCNSAAIEQMATYMPVTLSDLEKISGFGKIKVAQYGKQFVSIIAEYCEMHDIDPPQNTVPVKRQRKPGKAVKEDTKTVSFEKYSNGMAIDEIAKERNLSATTIAGHLAFFVQEGQIKIESLVKADVLATIRAVRKNAPTENISGLKSLLPDISYADIKFYLAAEKMSLA